MCVEKVVRLYTKTFGGKIWKHLHSVSPDNIFDKKFKMASHKSFRQKLHVYHPVQNVLLQNLIDWLSS